MTNVLTINAETHGEAAVELFERWAADTALIVSDDRLSSEEYETTVDELLRFLQSSGYNLHGYTVGGPGENGSYVRDVAGNIAIRLA